ncbi:MAG: aminodeoxychorismate synthase component I [Bacteroidota bacterium]
MQKIIDRINKLGKEKVPFLFILDFQLEKPIILPLSEVNSNDILFSINGITNQVCKPRYYKRPTQFSFKPVSKSRYGKAFSHVQKHIKHGNSFLVNLTMPTPIETNLSLEEIFHSSTAKYKLWVKNKFVVFSPETFIQTNGRKISSFPMKGTMDASLPNAKKLLLESEKELAEHYTIVDLIRNDLSMVAKNVSVTKFRYIDHLETNSGGLFQMSSEISGELPENYHNNLGEILLKMLPAGSISGAPKKKTLEIIEEAEQYKRGYYTGVCGIFDGENIDSGVMIRYIEQTPEGVVYKSGGGITVKSNIDEEYQELINKIYLPLK